jgi:hypothetical protein
LRTPKLLQNSHAVLSCGLKSHLYQPNVLIFLKVNKEKVVLFMHHYLRLLTKYSDLEILEACGKLDTNCFEIRQGGLNLRAMYRTACLMSHDCRPNTKHTFRTEDYAINLYSTVDIGRWRMKYIPFSNQPFPKISAETYEKVLFSLFSTFII